MSKIIHKFNRTKLYSGIDTKDLTTDKLAEHFGWALQHKIIGFNVVGPSSVYITYEIVEYEEVNPRYAFLDSMLIGESFLT